MGYTFKNSGPWGPGKGGKLSSLEADNNFWQAIQDIRAKAVQGVGLDNIVQTGNSLTFVLTDHTLLGPFDIPVILPNFVGPWQPDHQYLAGDILDAGGSVYGVLANHTSAATFDPGANDGLGQNYYQLLLSNPSVAIPSGGAVGQVLTKSTIADFAATWAWQTLRGLHDVAASPAPVVGDLVRWDGSEFAFAQPSSVATAGISLSQLQDVTILDSPPLTAGQLLMWDGAAWINADRVDATGFDPTVTTPVSGQILVYDSTSGAWKNKSTADIPVYGNVGVSGSISLNYANGGVQVLTMSSGVTLTGVTNWPPAGQLGRLMLIIQNSGAYTWTWPNPASPGYHWPGGASPTVTFNGRDIYALTTVDGGVNVDGSIIGQNYLP